MLNLRKADRADRAREREKQGTGSSTIVSEVRTRSAGHAKSQTTKRIKLGSLNEKTEDVQRQE